MAASGNTARWRIFRLQDRGDDRGQLNVFETSRALLPTIERTYFFFGRAAQTTRGQHAHRDLEQVMICLSGSLRLRLDDGTTTEEIVLDDPREALYVGPMVWRELDGFDESTICAVLASRRHDPDDYIHDHATFIREHQVGSSP